MRYYYLEKDTTSVRDILSWIQESRDLENNEGAIAPFSAFFSIIFSVYPESVPTWLKKTNFTGQAQKCIRWALALSHMKELDEEIFRDKLSTLPASPKNLLELTIQSPGDMDMMWGAFLASGDPRYVIKIIDVMEDSLELSGDQTLDSAMRSVAAWALSSNMLQHELVHRCIKSEIDKRGNSVRKSLILIENEYQKYTTPFSKKSGQFSAMLAIIDEKELVQYTNPTSDTLYIEEQAHAKRGDVFAIKVIFGGMALTDDLRGDVTFDLKILDPKGNIYDSTDIKGLAALDYRVPTRFAVYDNRNYATIRFEPNDLSGEYRFEVTIYDKIGMKDIKLSKSVKLEE